MKTHKFILITLAVALLAACGDNYAERDVQQVDLQEFGAYAKVGISLLQDGSAVGPRLGEQACKFLQEKEKEDAFPSIQKKIIRVKQEQNHIESVGSAIKSSFGGSLTVDLLNPDAPILGSKAASGSSGAALTRKQLIDKANTFFEGVFKASGEEVSNYYVAGFSEVHSSSASTSSSSQGLNAVVSDPTVAISVLHDKLPLFGLSKRAGQFTIKSTSSGQLTYIQASPVKVSETSTSVQLIKPSEAIKSIAATDLQGYTVGKCSLVYAQKDLSSSTSPAFGASLDLELVPTYIFDLVPSDSSSSKTSQQIVKAYK